MALDRLRLGCFTRRSENGKFFPKKGNSFHAEQTGYPAGEASDPKFQDQLLARLAELTGVALRDA